MTEHPAPRILARPEHAISRRNISTNALKVLYRLHRSGYLAYLVGGGARDLLLGKTPKDFDVATNARPQEVRRLFRNSRIIGRRFRLVHVFFRGETVEVATFRASPEPPEGPDEWEEAEQEAMEEVSEVAVPAAAPLDEGVYGTPAEDARRRDFTVNALFYNIADFSVIDYVGGIADLEARTLRTIGNPDERYREDPVRMMRALEYSVRLGFAMEEQTGAAIDRCSALIRDASPARLTYELLEGLRSGSAAGIYAAWRRGGIFDRAFPKLGCDDARTSLILRAVDEDPPPTGRYPDAGLIGSMFLVRCYELQRAVMGDGEKLDNAEYLAGQREIIDPVAASMHLSNHTVHLLHQGLFTLTKLRRPPERGRQVLKLVRQDYFPVAWDLYRLASVAGLVDPSAFRLWSRAVHRARRGRAEQDLVPAPEAAPSRRRRRRRPRRKRRI